VHGQAIAARDGTRGEVDVRRGLVTYGIRKPNMRFALLVLSISRTPILRRRRGRLAERCIRPIAFSPQVGLVWEQAANASWLLLSVDVGHFSRPLISRLYRKTHGACAAGIIEHAVLSFDPRWVKPRPRGGNDCNELLRCGEQFDRAPLWQRSSEMGTGLSEIFSGRALSLNPLNRQVEEMARRLRLASDFGRPRLGMTTYITGRR